MEYQGEEVADCEDGKAMDVKEGADVEMTESQNDDPNKTEPNPFSYVENSAFTSEKYKIVIRGLPKYFSIKDFRKFLNVKLKLNCNKVKMMGRIAGNVAYACFRSEEERDKGLKVINESTWKKRKLNAKLCQPAPDPYITKRLLCKEMKDDLDTVEKQKEALLKSVSPLFSIPYEEQLESKEKCAKKALHQLGIALQKDDILKEWLSEQKANCDGLPCKLLGIQSLKDFTERYRNKCEFSIARNELTGKKTVGFRLGTYASGSVTVVSAEDIKIIPNVMVQATKAFEKFIRQSKYEPYSPKTLTGNWKMLTVRVGTQTDELMLLVGFDPQKLSDDEIKDVKEKIKEFFRQESECLKVDSLYFRLMPRNEKGQKGYSPELLYGKTHIEEILCGLRFRISPESFFQINSRCAELLVKCIKDLANIDKETIVVDVYCGTGTLGLCLANDCKEVFGIEVLEQAVKDAQENAKMNNIQNSTFFTGKADDILTSVLKKANEDAKVVAIVDPPRAGLHKYAVQKLRSAKNLQRFVYLACDAKSALNNFTELGRAPSKTLLGDPFVPVAAIPVDMFPMTNHYELIIFFERLPSKNAS
ncbi:tRNA (uracil-5-)-methyltransferase homolog A [Cimex lectularius]|uniref:tRNA (uracil(54)-C(5))-methyltransferase n=1 Tax=Cimex lectularius TaxID=79782 RepID=A0A8I6R7H8_CIMLE|nr:tRNA (uracil-5-)-methyltransferase homolog A [Cimex lectularius]